MRESVSKKSEMLLALSSSDLRFLMSKIELGSLYRPLPQNLSVLRLVRRSISLGRNVIPGLPLRSKTVKSVKLSTFGLKSLRSLFRRSRAVPYLNSLISISHWS